MTADQHDIQDTAGETLSRQPSSSCDQMGERADGQGEQQPVEIGGRKGPEPTRYGDWEKGGRCIDF